MTTDSTDNGKPTCCGPGDLSVCVIETTEARNNTDSRTQPPKKNTETDETKSGGKA